MFSGKLVDNRTRTQRHHDRARHQPQQQLMFSQREMAQFGVNSTPLLALSPDMSLPLIAEDPRTEEQIEADRERQARENTKPLFDLAPALALVQKTPHAYLQHLNETLQLPAPDTLQQITAGTEQACITDHPAQYLKHLQQTPQLPEKVPKTYKVALPAQHQFENEGAAIDAFEDFLTRYRVYDRARRYGWSKTQLLDADDIAQMVAIQLWDRWWHGDQPIYASTIRFAIRDRSRDNKWTARIIRGKDPRSSAIEAAHATVDLQSEQEDLTGHETLDGLIERDLGADKMRGMAAVDRRIDVEEAIQTTVLYMMWLESLKPNPRHRTDPQIVPERVDALLKGYMYYRNGGALGHVGGRHNSYLHGYWKSRGLQKAMGLKWRDRVFPILAGLLAEYQLPNQ